MFHFPAVHIPNIHVLDEANDVTNPLKCLAKLHDRMLIHSTLDNHVDFNGSKSHLGSFVNSIQDLLRAEVPSIHLGEDFVIVSAG